MAASDRLVEEMGLIFQESGGPRIAGRIFGLLLIEGRELSLHQISERLGVSRASVSTNTRLLSKGGILKRTTHAGDRQDYYELVGFPYTDIIGQVAQQFRRNARVTQGYVAAVRTENADAGARVEALAAFYGQSADLFEGWAEKLQETASHGEKA